MMDRRMKEWRARRLVDEKMKEALRNIGEELERWRMERKREGE